MAAVTLDSEAAFRERCLKIGMEEATLDVLIASNYKTFGHLAFAVSSSPNTAEEEQVQQWVNTVFARPPTPQQMACIRRAFVRGSGPVNFRYEEPCRASVRCAC